MFTRDDYLVLLSFDKQEARSIRGLEPGPRVLMAEKRLFQHIMAGLPRPEGVPPDWWERQVKAVKAAVAWYEEMRAIPDFPRPHWAD